MANTTGYYGKRGELRLVSGQPDGIGGKYFYKVAFEGMDLAAVIGRPRPDELPVLDRGLYTSFAHFLQGPDTPLMTPVQITFSCQIESTVNRTELRKALSNPENDSPWVVGGITWTDTNGTSVQYNGFGSAISTAQPYDPLQRRINLETLWSTDPAATSATGFRFTETYFRPDQVRIQEAPDSLRLQVTGWCYGGISAITAFGAGTDVSGQ
jgi:hypothetical protein